MVNSSTESTELNQLNNQLIDQLNGFITNDTIQSNNNNIYTKINEIYTNKTDPANVIVFDNCLNLTL